MKRKLLLAGLIVLIVVVGFYRDSVFVPINAMIEKGADTDGSLSLLKWGLTVLFSVIYMAITSAFLFFLFNKIRYVFIALAVYAFLILVSFGISSFGYMLFSFQEVYPFVRTIMGIVQSPIIAMVLIAGCLIDDIFQASE